MMIPSGCCHSALARSVSIDAQLTQILLITFWPILVMTRSNAFACRFTDGRCCCRITVSWEPPTPPDQCDTYSARNVDNSDAMDLADVDNEVMVVDDEDIMAANDEEVFCVSSSWSHSGVDSLMVR